MLPRLAPYEEAEYPSHTPDLVGFADGPVEDYRTRHERRTLPVCCCSSVLAR